MKYRRGRVTISVPFIPNPLEAVVAPRCQWLLTAPHPRIHVGHARSMLIGELICRDLGIPYHLRLDMEIANHALCFDIGLIDTLACVAWLGIQADYTYRMRQPPKLDAYYEQLLGKDVWAHLMAERTRWARMDLDAWLPICDDFEWYPSLKIRGAEWSEPEKYHTDFPAPMPPLVEFRRLIEYEKMPYEAVLCGLDVVWNGQKVTKVPEEMLMENMR